MNSTKYITKVMLLLIGVLGSGGVGPINNHNLNIVNFLRSQGLHALSKRFLAEGICQWYGNNIDTVTAKTMTNLE